MENRDENRDEIKKSALYMTEKEIRKIKPFAVYKEYNEEWRDIFINLITPLYELLPKKERNSFEFSKPFEQLTCFVMITELIKKLSEIYTKDEIIKRYSNKK